MGGQTDGRSSRLAGSRLLALCAPGRLPIPFVASACGKQWPRCQVPDLDSTPPTKVRPRYPEVALGPKAAGERGPRRPAPSQPQAGVPGSPPVVPPDGARTSSSSL